MSWKSVLPKVLIIASQIAVVSILVFAALPIATGGLTANVDTLEVRDNNDTLIFEGQITLDLNLNFDLTNFEYEVKLDFGKDVISLYKSSVETIKKHGITSIQFTVEISKMKILEYAVYDVSTGTAQPMNLSIHVMGDFISYLVKFDVNPILPISDTIDGKIMMTDDGKSLTATASMPYSLGWVIEGLETGKIDAIIKDNGSDVISVSAVMTNMKNTNKIDSIVTMTSMIDRSLIDIIRSLISDTTTILINDVEYKLSKEDLNILIKIMECAL